MADDDKEYDRSETYRAFLRPHYIFRPVRFARKIGGHLAEFHGVVAWFNNAKGFGFLQREGGPDTFVHYSAIVADGFKTLKEGDPVEFDVVQGEKGLQAANVKRL